MPITGLYYKFLPKKSGTLRVKVWVKKDRRRTFVVDGETMLPITYKKEGYINGQNDASGQKRYLSDEEINNLHDGTLGEGVEPWVIVYNYLIFRCVLPFGRYAGCVTLGMLIMLVRLAISSPVGRI